MSASETFADTDRILSVDLDEPADGGPGDPDLEQERRVAVYDLVEESRFALRDAAAAGPYRLRFGVDGEALRLAVMGEEGAALADIAAPLGELKETVRDYVALCRDYRDAVRRLAPSQIEKIDEARKEAHLEGGEMLAEAISDAARMDAQTARRFFTVLCALIAAPRR